MIARNEDDRTVSTRIVKRVCEALERRYGRPRHGNPADPLDDLIYIVISNKTAPEVAARVYRTLKSRFPKWEQLVDARLVIVQRLLREAGLWKIKARQIRAALRSIRRRGGTCDLKFLRAMTPADAEAFLTSLPGVSLKVAKCVLMYTCRVPVLPVDTHTHRVALRLGWTDRKRPDQCHSELEAVVPPRYRYAFHVDAVAHGRLVCRPEKPRCSDCCIQRHCPFFSAGVDGSSQADRD